MIHLTYVLLGQDELTHIWRPFKGLKGTTGGWKSHQRDTMQWYISANCWIAIIYYVCMGSHIQTNDALHMVRD